MCTAVGRATQRYRNAIAFSGMCTHPCEPSVLYFGLPYGNCCQDASWKPNSGASNGIQYFTTYVAPVFSVSVVLRSGPWIQ